MLYVHLLLKAFMTETKPHVENLIQTCLLGFSLLYLKQVLHCSYQASKLCFIGYYLNLFFSHMHIDMIYVHMMSSTQSHIVFYLEKHKTWPSKTVKMTTTRRMKVFVPTFGPLMPYTKETLRFVDLFKLQCFPAIPLICQCHFRDAGAMRLM